MSTKDFCNKIVRISSIRISRFLFPLDELTTWQLDPLNFELSKLSAVKLTVFVEKYTKPLSRVVGTIGGGNK